MSYSKIFLSFLIIPAISLLITGCFSGKRKTTGEEQFFLYEKGVSEHGKKTVIDRIYQLDPGDEEFEVSDRFETNPPRKIAVLPFDNLVGGNYILNEIPIPRFSKEKGETWNWTYANRLRRFFFGHLAAREFQDIELMYIDKTLQKLQILTPNDLKAVPPQELGRILGADALIYGKVTDYKNSYYTLFAQIRIGLRIRCVSTEDGSVLFEGEHKRYDNDIRVATN
ncbi:MAG: GNA1162 family protein, partial [Planctomycetota bacterium]